MLIPFLATAFVLLILPGPTNTVLAACGARHGLRGSASLLLAASFGYIAAISACLLAMSGFGGSPSIAATIRLVAAAWLAYSAVRLWRFRSGSDSGTEGNRFARVFITTLVNPKALLVATVLLPETDSMRMVPYIGAFALLAMVTGFAWIWLGAMLPEGVRTHANKLAALILALFSVLAAVSSLRA